MKYRVSVDRDKDGELEPEEFETATQVKAYLKQLLSRYPSEVLDVLIEGPRLRQAIEVQLWDGQIHVPLETPSLDVLLSREAGRPPATYYHVTGIANLKGIQERGLVGRRGGTGENILQVDRPGGEVSGYHLFGGQPESIYLFRSLEEAKAYAQEREEPTAILKTRIRQTLYPDPEMYTGEGDVMSVRGPIPPSDITVVDEDA